MSRIGKLPIPLPAGVTVEVSPNNVVTVKGPLGTLKQVVDPVITIKNVDGQLHVERHTDQRNHRSMHGLYRSLIANMVKGVSDGFKIIQELVGVGYKVSNVGQVLEFSLGYSHSVFMELPAEINVTTLTERGKSPTITLQSTDKQLIGQVAAKIRSLREPEPYKGKGIRFAGENIRKKAGKTASK
ncbi:MAG: 50S ribosomal protein L6 [Bacteroidales bacterium]|nr:50S ribosomal protein L6 [Bacteroidales bacterium]MDZ4204444.1 50S ribosomal protein L6 [Bacteroidales bacterium]